MLKLTDMAWLSEDGRFIGIISQLGLMIQLVNMNRPFKTLWTKLTKHSLGNNYHLYYHSAAEQVTTSFLQLLQSWAMAKHWP